MSVSLMPAIMKNKNIPFRITILAMIMFSAVMQGQTFEEFKKQREKEMQQMKTERQEFLQKMQKSFDTYVEQRNKEFADYLENEWEQFSLFKARKPVFRPKPDEMPEFSLRKDEEIQKIPSINNILELKTKPGKETLLPRVHGTAVDVGNRLTLEVEFYGDVITLEADEDLFREPENSLDEASISRYWSKLSETDYNGLIDQLTEFHTLMNLNDWGYFQLLSKTADALYRDSSAGATLFQWFMMLQSGYDARVAFNSQSVTLLLPSFQTIYFKRFLEMDGVTYYLMEDIEGDEIHTYTSDFPDATKIMDFNIYRPIYFSGPSLEKKVSFTHNSKEYDFTFLYNKNMMDFYAGYPVVDINVYFNAAMPVESKESILQGFMPVIDQMDTHEALTFLLAFVQGSFDYKTDQEQFGHEKFFFPAEVFYYPYSDCEDRSALFTYLVSELLDLKVIGLTYTGHVATAVHLETEVAGDFLVYENEKYVIADPTYVNAPLGMTMPEYRGQNADVIQLANRNHQWERINMFWELAMASGGKRGGNLNDAVIDEEGNAYLTGFIDGQAGFGKHRFESPDGKRKMFVVRYDKDGNVSWADVYQGDGNSAGFAITLDVNGFPVAAGSFNGRISPGEAELSLTSGEGRNDVMMAKYNSRGRLIWAGRSGLDEYRQDTYLSYVTWFGPNGEHEKTRLFNENENFRNFGLYAASDGRIYFAGAFNNTTGMNYATLALNDGRVQNPVESLKAENDILLKDNYDPTIAGMFAAANLMLYNGFKISGRDAQQALDKYNPDFRKKYDAIYENLGKINFIMNDEGIINISTSDGNSVRIDKIKINNGSRIKINGYPSGDAQINVLSGIEVGKLVVWFNLNFIRMFKLNGDLLFDYDSDHTQKLMNLKEDILE